MNGLFVNIDINSVNFPYIAYMTERDSLKPEDINEFVDQYAGTQVTDLAFDVFCQFSATPSGVWTDILDIYERKTENGHPVDHTKSVGMFYKIYKKFGIDPFAVWFARCREKGLTSWLSIRMNDCHCPDEETVWLRGSEFYEGSEKGWKVGPAYGYMRHCFNYANAEFRARMLAYITEQLLRYDTDGLELDYSREWVCFDYLNDPDCHRIMTEFLRDVKKAVGEAENKWGHRIRIKINCMRDIAQNKVLGLDMETLVSEGIADVIGVGPRWASNDSNLPVREWKEKFPDTPVYPTVTDLTLGKGTTFEMAAGYAAAYLSQGADKLGLYNFFIHPAPANAFSTGLFAQSRRIHRTCGDTETLASQPKRFVLTYQDFVPLNRTGWKPLPAKAEGFAEEIITGDIPAGETVNLILGTDQPVTGDMLRVTVNGKTLSSGTPTKFAAPHDPSPYEYRYSIPADAVSGRDIQRILLSAGEKDLTVSYAEITVGIDIAG